MDLIINSDKLQTLTDAGIIPANTPPAQVQLFAEACRQHGLSPFKKEIYLLSYNTREGTRYATIVGIDGLQQKAARTGRFAGVDQEQYDLLSNGSFKTSAELAAEKRLPISCTVTVYAIIGGVRCPFTATALFAEYYPYVAGGKDNYSKAATMPFNMIAKCARAKALRMAFADELSGLAIEEEKAAYEDKTITAIEVNPASAIDADELREQLELITDVDRLRTVYKSDAKYKQFADIFSQRAEVIRAQTIEA
jgi:phage recombination protein Bet